MSRIRVEMRDTSISGSTPWRLMIDTGMPWLSSNIAEKRSAASIVCRPARLAWCSASLNTSFAAGDTRRSRPAKAGTMLQVLLEGLQDGVRVQLEIAHHLREQVPFDLGERQEDVLVPEDRVVAPAGFLDRAIDNPLR